ncbi:unnamed protein product [Calicophoron daubneyi]|uniref:Hemoglobinase n=1 Tax=Calicophoron daubneyi TaxID=300641 RepID=A0AAV2TLT0_CALDB
MHSQLTLTILIYALTLPRPNLGARWAVLVAGSSGWWNYRHQADVSHAQKILLKNGIPSDHIITMMYDDVAYNRQNPFPGKLFNDYTHTDVYEGITIDYRREEVTPKNFLGVLLGDEELVLKGKKVLRSGPEDNVFIFFTDHGSEHLIAFPHGELYADTLIETLNKMHSQNRYHNMVIYLEACYSGSMFEGLLDKSIQIHALTAANAHESSYATFCNDRKISACLADEFSYQWMNVSVQEDLERWTLNEEFRTVKKKVQHSHVTKYGDQSLDEKHLADFIGSSSAGTRGDLFMKPRHYVPALDAVFVPIHRKMIGAETTAAIRLAELEFSLRIQRMKLVQDTFKYIEEASKTLKGGQILKPHQRTKMALVKCFHTIHETFTQRCFHTSTTPEVIPYLSRFTSMCENGLNPEDIVEIIREICS